MQEVIVTVDSKGGLKVETKGFVGTECHEATRALEAMGAVTSDTPTDEMYAQESIDQQNGQRVRA